MSTKLKNIIQHFNPAWFSAVMGTGIIPLAIFHLDFAYKNLVATIFFSIAILMFLLAIIPWTLKFIMFKENAKKDLQHPILSSFFPTMPIAMIVLSLVFLKYPESLLTKSLSLDFAFYLWVLGAFGVYLIGFVILNYLFRHPETDIEHANFGWYIPPISKLAVALGGFELAQIFPEHSPWLFTISIISFGVGFFLFIFVGANVYHRYIYHELPMNKLAATFLIGMTPTSVCALIVFKMMELFKYQNIIGIDYATIASVGKIVMLISWGLSVWWFIMACFVISYYIRKIKLPYALSWWAFAFPLGTLSTTTGLIWKITNYTFIQQFYWIILSIFILAWTIVFMRTIKAIFTDHVFQTNN